MNTGIAYRCSAGAWDAAGRRFALAALSGGEPVLTILHPDQRLPRLDIRLDGFGEIYNPSWSPDGTQIVFSGLKAGD